MSPSSPPPVPLPSPPIGLLAHLIPTSPRAPTSLLPNVEASLFALDIPLRGRSAATPRASLAAISPECALFRVRWNLPQAAGPPSGGAGSGDPPTVPTLMGGSGAPTPVLPPGSLWFYYVALVRAPALLSLRSPDVHVLFCLFAFPLLVDIRMRVACLRRISASFSFFFLLWTLLPFPLLLSAAALSVGSPFWLFLSPAHLPVVRSMPRSSSFDTP